MAPTRSPVAPAAPACVCGRMRRASRALTQLYDDAMAPAGLRVTQFSLLRTLAQHGSMRVTALAAAALLDRTALTRTLEPLVARRLVTVRAGADARTREVALTRSGAAALRAATPYWEGAQAAVAGRLGAPDVAALVRLLRDVESLHPDAMASST
jgi:DNA-binding MarR family transcriptional regulator